MLRYDDRAAPHRSLVADVGKDDIILGYPFFEAVNPDEDWPTGTLAQGVHLMEHKDWVRTLVGEEGSEAWSHWVPI